jgi:hypothetical protein
MEMAAAEHHLNGLISQNTGAMTLENIRKRIDKHGTEHLLDALPLPEDLLWVQHSVANPKTALVIGGSSVYEVVAYLARYGDRGMSRSTIYFISADIQE